jgi:formamidase
MYRLFMGVADPGALRIHSARTLGGNRMHKSRTSGLILFVMVSLIGLPVYALDEPVLIRAQGDHCVDDPNCFNRFHPEVPMNTRAKPGQLIVMEVRNAGDLHLDSTGEWKLLDPPGSTIHPITGPVYIEGAKAGDVLAVSLIEAKPSPYGYTIISQGGFLADVFPDEQRVYWELGENYATSRDLPGLRIPNASFPGIVTTLPGPSQHAAILTREAKLAVAGGSVSPPEPANASPGNLCGPTGSEKEHCARTFPPREYGGHLDIRYLQAGVTVYLPCYVDGCGLGLGDPHYAQGDGEVSGTAIEMGGTFTLRTKVIKGLKLPRGPHYEGPASVLRIPSTRVYATTGIPLKRSGSVPPDMSYLESDERIGEFENLSKDISLATRNALLEMIDYIVATQGLTREQAYMVASVAVDMRIGQLVDSPNVGVTAVLPLDIFVK